MKILSALVIASAMLCGCISSGSPNPPAKTTVVVPPSSTTTVVCARRDQPALPGSANRGRCDYAVAAFGWRSWRPVAGMFPKGRSDSVFASAPHLRPELVREHDAPGVNAEAPQRAAPRLPRCCRYETPNTWRCRGNRHCPRKDRAVDLQQPRSCVRSDPQMKDCRARICSAVTLKAMTCCSPKASAGVLGNPVVRMILAPGPQRPEEHRSVVMRGH